MANAYKPDPPPWKKGSNSSRTTHAISIHGIHRNRKRRKPQTAKAVVDRLRDTSDLDELLKGLNSRKQP